MSRTLDSAAAHDSSLISVWFLVYPVGQQSLTLSRLSSFICSPLSITALSPSIRSDLTSSGLDSECRRLTRAGECMRERNISGRERRGDGEGHGEGGVMKRSCSLTFEELLENVTSNEGHEIYNTAAAAGATWNAYISRWGFFSAWTHFDMLDNDREARLHPVGMKMTVITSPWTLTLRRPDVFTLSKSDLSILLPTYKALNNKLHLY